MDISHDNSEVFAELLTLWDQYKEEVGVVGLKGQYGDGSDNTLKDEFEDTGKWIRWIGKEDVPDAIREKL